MRLTRPTRAAGRERPRDYCGIAYRNVAAAPTRSCSRWGLPCHPCCQGCGALLPHRFALARGTGLLARAGLARAVCFLWHCPWGRPRRRLAGTAFPWSPDFPPPMGLRHRRRPSSCLARQDVRPGDPTVKRSGRGSVRPGRVRLAPGSGRGGNQAVAPNVSGALKTGGQCGPHQNPE